MFRTRKLLRVTAQCNTLIDKEKNTLQFRNCLFGFEMSVLILVDKCRRQAACIYLHILCTHFNSNM